MRQFVEQHVKYVVDITVYTQADLTTLFNVVPYTSTHVMVSYDWDLRVELTKRLDIVGFQVFNEYFVALLDFGETFVFLYKEKYHVKTNDLCIWARLNGVWRCLFGACCRP